MPVGVNRLRRRPHGERTLIYLDQSTLSALAREDALHDLLELLREGVQSGAFICPKSSEHAAETMLATDSWASIDELADELAMGVEFEDPEMIEWYEIMAAACVFLQRAPERDVWREAFRTNPHAPVEELFPGGFRVRAAFAPQDFLIHEVEHLKRSERIVNQAYEAARAAGRTFEEQADLEFEAMLDWKLGPLFVPDTFAARLERLKHEAALEMLVPGAWDRSGSAFRRYSAVSLLKSRADSFLDHFPELRDRRDEFKQSAALRSVPSLRYPTLLRAALAVMPGRRARLGDPYDIAHLARGLSRCDVVTADSGMAHVCRHRALVPDGCELFSARELDALAERLRAELATH